MIRHLDAPSQLFNFTGRHSIVGERSSDSRHHGKSAWPGERSVATGVDHEVVQLHLEVILRLHMLVVRDCWFGQVRYRFPSIEWQHGSLLQ